MNDLRFDNLTIGYELGTRREKVVARGLTDKLETGELTCLTGRNGVGKSTLLRALAKLWQGDVAVVLTTPIDMRHTTAREVVALGRTPYTNFWGTLKQNDITAVEESLQLVGMEHLADCDIDKLSDGERQKVIIAKALAQQTPIIILDEPTAFLDYPGKQSIMQLLQRLAHEQGKTILLSTHDIELAEQYADQIWMMDGTRLLTGAAHLMNIRNLFT